MTISILETFCLVTFSFPGYFLSYDISYPGMYFTKVCLVMGDADPWAAGTAEPGRISSPHFHRCRCDGRMPQKDGVSLLFNASAPLQQQKAFASLP